MRTFDNDAARRLAPRWRDLSRTAAAGELRSLHTRQPDDHSELLRRKIASWEEKRGILLAADVVAAAIVLGHKDLAQDAAEYLLGAEKSSAPLTRLASQVLGDEAEVEISPRQLLKLEPRDSLAWVELARRQASRGAVDKAERSMLIALDLAPDSRFVLRSAARLAIHAGDPQRALYAIRKSVRSREDPWLIAADLAASDIAEVISPLAKTGRKLVEGDFDPFDISELAAGLAQLELGSGSLRKARKLLALALVRPTDNTAAQVEWEARGQQRMATLVDKLNIQQPLFAEARAIDFYRQRDWLRSLTACDEWLKDEPFSTRPAIIGSFVAAICLEDYEASIRFARAGLVANPQSEMLLNNMAFALASANRVSEARIYHRKLSEIAGDEWASFRLATGGLIAFRASSPEEGRSLYLQAIAVATGKEKAHTRATAQAFLAREEFISHTGLGESALLSAREESRSLTGDDAMFVEKIIGKAESLR